MKAKFQILFLEKCFGSHNSLMAASIVNKEPKAKNSVGRTSIWLQVYLAPSRALPYAVFIQLPQHGTVSLFRACTGLLCHLHLLVLSLCILSESHIEQLRVASWWPVNTPFLFPEKPLISPDHYDLTVHWDSAQKSPFLGRPSCPLCCHLCPLRCLVPSACHCHNSIYQIAPWWMSASLLIPLFCEHFQGRVCVCVCVCVCVEGKREWYLAEVLLVTLKGNFFLPGIK